MKSLMFDKTDDPREASRRSWFGLIFVAALLSPITLTACAQTPATYFDWGTSDPPEAGQSTGPGDALPVIRARPSRPAAEVVPKARPAKMAAADDAVTPVARPQVALHRPVAIAGSVKIASSEPPEKPVKMEGNLHFAWPVSGPVISGFGTSADGQRNDGINIAADLDAPIYAAAGGTISYAGDGVKSYGNLILIRHQGDYFTAYAHADKILVKRGDVVAAGQLIGYCGATGDVSAPQLHFEIRRGVQPLDPKHFLVAKS